MRIGIIQGTTQVSKNELLHNAVVKAVGKKGYDVFNFGVYPNEKQSYSYTEIAFLTALLINSKAIDFVITGCSSGQGMNLACNTLPGLLSGFIQNPQDAYLFGRINDGNVASLSLGLGFGWLGELNLEYTLEKLFDGEFGIGYPADVAERKVRETHRVKEFNKMSKISMIELMKNMDRDFIDKIMTKKNVIHYIIENSNEVELVDYLIKEIS
ncbi:RpiB/LacA/LacB family sugar-phosphate isomerase [Lactococcus ileimucosae]|uniref:RpiB/LacA/LacB family sugar-phosphate isomerase n=1 Tax=Lactococcus ileimucosae TaxID=2941329 RepID=A0ABV4D2N6_9LACT|nr:RpiB/LacA/LacB family sugar-phosphate isomerase [Lactococcus ileimucosae]